jgi:type IV secretion system protein VirD4
MINIIDAYAVTAALAATPTPAPSPSPTSLPDQLTQIVPPQFVSFLSEAAPFGLAGLAALTALGAWRVSPYGQPALPGMATRSELRRQTGKWAARRSAARTRPSMTRPQRWQAPGRECGVWLGKSLGPRRTLWGRFADTYLVLGVTRQGKDTLIANAIIDHPGPVIYATTKTEDLRLHLRLRAGKGPVAVLNLEGQGEIPSSLRWSPVAGCQDPQVAIQRAGYMLMGARSGGFKGLKHEDFFTSKAATLLRAFLIAAACSGRTLLDVYRWANDERSNEPVLLLEKANAEAGGRYSEFIADIRGMQQSAAGVTTGSIYQTLSTELQFLASPQIAKTVDVAPAEGHFDVAEFVRRAGTLYLVAEDRPESPTVGPLLTALAGHIVEQAKLLGSKMPGGRLDPPLLLVLNECDKITPLPIDRYFGHHAGMGITTVAMVQSRSMLEERWGVIRARAIWDNATVKIQFGGGGDTQHMEEVVKLCGEYEHKTTTRSRGPHGITDSVHTERRPVLTTDRIRLLSERRFLIVRSNMRPTLAKTRRTWWRRDVRASLKTCPGVPELVTTFTPPQTEAAHPGQTLEPEDLERAS